MIDATAANTANGGPGRQNPLNGLDFLRVLEDIQYRSLDNAIFQRRHNYRALSDLAFAFRRRCAMSLRELVSAMKPLLEDC